ncbi:MAG: chemotaxis protein CheB [Syntrophobacteraceae bacterium]|nr:PAS domain-containing protein [Desulfobacteraceae bacterium]
MKEMKDDEQRDEVGGGNQTDAGKEAGGGQFPIVAIGASAGGLEAIEAFLSHMPSDSGMAFVVIQHLGAHSKSMLGEILKKHTSMAIREVADGLPIEVNHVYFNPPDQEVAMWDGVFLLRDIVRTGSIRLPIDYFLRSLAADRHERAICIILSGTGSDGTLGLTAIKEQGGLAIVQDDTQARYDGMPRSAIDTGLVDYVLPVEAMPGELLSYVQQPYLKGTREEGKEEKKLVSHVERILLLLRSKTGRDFIQYKQKTIRRRIERRMAVHKIESIGDYLRYLQENTDEVYRLSKEFLIGVTSFFRDAKAFEVLAEKVIPSILSSKPEGATARVWVPGCATGEEALSLAMVFAETSEKLGKQIKAQIFATDIDSEAIERARNAEYPESISTDVSEKRLKRFFIKRDGKYKVKSEIREMVVYAIQDLTSDPPFSKLDLISCRNLLIYMDAQLQKKIMPLFHYTLNANGYLFLGPSETIGEFSDLFSPVDIKWKLFQAKKMTIPKYPLNLTVGAVSTVELGKQGAQVAKMPRRAEILERLILDEYAPASVLIDEKYETLFFRGPVGRYLELPKGEATLNLLSIAREGLRHKLPPAIQKATKTGSQVVLENTQISHEGRLLSVDVTIRPYRESEVANVYAVVFMEKTPAGTLVNKRKKIAGKEVDPRIAELEQELQATRESLQTTIEELEASNEELKSANEELQSTNEEMQSTNEEIETSKEELQSTNEELVTLNAELHSKVDELTELNNDISNLLASTEVGMLFLDVNFVIHRFTPSMTKFFHLISADVGRSIWDITPKIQYTGLREDAETVLATLQSKEITTRSDGSDYLSIRLLPYRTRDNVIDGLVITFTDITDRVLAELRHADAVACARALLEMARDPVLILDFDFKVVSANKPFYRTFRYMPEQTEGKSIFDVANREWDVPNLRELLEKVVREGSTFENLEMEGIFPGMGRFLCGARPVRQSADREGAILVTITGGAP